MSTEERDTESEPSIEDLQTFGTERENATDAERWERESEENVEKWGEQSLEELHRATTEEVLELNHALMHYTNDDPDGEEEASLAQVQAEVDDLAALMFQLQGAINRELDEKRGEA